MESVPVHETSWPEEYATGRLPVERRVEFEAHLVGCAECLDRVETAERMQAGIHELERRPFTATPIPPRRAGPRWAGRLGWGLAAAAAVAVAFWSGTLHTRSAEQALAVEREALARTEAELGRTRAELERARGAPELAPPGARRTTGRVPVLALLTRRGHDVPSVVLPESGPVAFWVERELPVRFDRYHVRVRSEQGTSVFEDDVSPATREALLVALDAKVLAPGLYTLALEGEARGGRRIPVTEHPFRTLAGPVR